MGAENVEAHTEGIRRKYRREGEGVGDRYDVCLNGRRRTTPRCYEPVYSLEDVRMEMGKSWAIT